MAPPTMAAIIRLEPLLVSGPRPWIPNVKIDGNMMELQIPTASKAAMAK